MSEVYPKSFETLLQTHDKPILVDFWAPWCGPCKMVAPELEKLAKDWKGKVSIIKVNTDEKQEIAGKYGISGIPTFILFKNGKEVHRISGLTLVGVDATLLLLVLTSTLPTLDASATPSPIDSGHFLSSRVFTFFVNAASSRTSSEHFVDAASDLAAAFLDSSTAFPSFSVIDAT